MTGSAPIVLGGNRFVSLVDLMNILDIHEDDPCVGVMFYPKAVTQSSKPISVCLLNLYSYDGELYFRG